MASSSSSSSSCQLIPMGFTENLSPTFLSTGNPCLDFFFHIVPDTPAETLTQFLQLAWKHNDLITIKLICHLRGVCGTRKSDKQGFYIAALWLHKHHPKTLACNSKSIANFGYLKDLPEILYRILEGFDVRKLAKDEFQRRTKPRAAMVVSRRRLLGGNRRGRGRGERYYNGEKRTTLDSIKQGRNKKFTQSRDERLAVEMKKVQIQKESARDLRKEKEIAKAKKAFERHARDPDFRFLHDQISQVFADYLVSDLKSLNCSEIGKISLAAKWCPSLDSSFDKSILLCESIARRVFPRDSYPEYAEIEEAHYVFRVCDRLRKEVLVPLRQVLELPEVYMSSNKWNSIPYGRVASVAMTNYKQNFLKHDEERFNQYLRQVRLGEAKIAAGALLPLEIINHLEDGDGGHQVAELQWKRMIDDLSAKGKLKNCLPISDVSQSMEGEPMEVSVALGLMVSELSDDPWKGKVITFSADPELHIIEGDDLRSKVDSISNMDAGLNTDFQKVFDLILQVAVAGNLSKDQMIKKVFVFSDMEFDEASGMKKFHCSYNPETDNTWNTDYEVIQKKFQNKGHPVPKMVFWNIRDSDRVHSSANDQKGVALVSGFSKNLITLFLDEKEEMQGPEAVMDVEMDGEEELTIINGDKIAEQIQPFAALLEAIRKAFKNISVNVDDINKQFESLRLSMVEAQKKKNIFAWWSNVSTFVTVAVVAYVARVR